MARTAPPAAGPPPHQRKKPTPADPTLAADVAALAASLGLTPGFAPGGGGGFDDEDFRPENARKRIGGGEPTLTAKGEKNARPAVGRPAGQQQPRHAHGRGPATSDRAVGNGGGGRHHQQHSRGFGGFGQAAAQPSSTPAPPPPSLLGKDGGGGAPWYEAAAESVGALGPDAAGPPPSPPSDALVAAARAAGGALLEGEAASAAAARSRSRDADARWLAAASSGGTASDRIAASALLIADRPAAGLAALDDLIKLAGKRAGARGPAAAALDALADLFAGPLLPPDRRLVPLGARNLAAVLCEPGSASPLSAPPSKAKARVLLWWALEDALKRRAAEFLEMLASASKDALPMLRSKAARAAAGLLASRPEGEATALALLVNKLGDPSRRLASDAAHLLDGVLARHPAMAPVVADAVEKFALRHGQAERARYTAVLFLSTLPLARSGAGAALASRLVDAYFGLFAAILSGGLGHAAAVEAAREAKAAAAAKGRRSGKKARHVARPGRKDADDADAKKPPPPATVAGIDARMLGALLTGVRRAVPFLAPGAADELASRHADPLFRVAGAAPLPTAVQALALLFQLLTARAAVSDRWYRSLYARLGDSATPRTGRPAPLLSLTYRAAKADPVPGRVAAFLKRLLQAAASAPSAGYAAGCLLLVSEVLKAKPALRAMVSQPEEDGEGGGGRAAARPRPPAGGDGSSSEGEDARPAPTPTPASADAGAYDPTKRDPLHARAGGACLWELLPLARHAHPSVAAFARTLLAGQPISYDGDPLADFAGAAVLDKIIAKKPKARPRAPVLGGAGGSLSVAAGTPAPGTAAFAALAADAVKPDEAFLHKWYAARAAAPPKAGRRKKDDDEEGGGRDGADTFALDSDEEADVDALLAREEGGAGEEGIGADHDGGGDAAAEWEAALADALAEDAVAGARARALGGQASSDDGDDLSDSGDGGGSEEPSSSSGGGGGSEEEAGGQGGGGSTDGGGGGSASDASDSPFGGSSDDDGGGGGSDDDDGDQAGSDDDLGGIPSASGSEEVDTDTEGDGSTTSSGEWVMAPGAEDGAQQHGEARAKKKGKRARDEPSSSDSDGSGPSSDDEFADADEYAAMIEADEKGEGGGREAGGSGRRGGGGGRPAKRPAPAGRRRAGKK